MLLFLLVAVMTVWMHVAIRRMERRRHPGLADERYLSDVPDRPLDAPSPSDHATGAIPSATTPAPRPAG